MRIDREPRPRLERHFYMQLLKAAAVPVAVVLIGFLLVELKLF